MATNFDTSYNQAYTVVSATSSHVILRPVDDSLLRTYWREFVSATIDQELPALRLKLTAVPPAVTRVEANTAYDLEYPRVTLEGNGVEVDLSSRVTANKPDAQTPGLYKIQYQLPLPGNINNVVWEAYVSIEEPPVLRNAITPWNRENYTLATLNRLVIEPQFQTALYEEGAPLYNFVTSNMSPALRPTTARRCFNARAYKSGKNLFVSGYKLPLASSVVVDGGPGDSFELHLDRVVLATGWVKQDYAEGTVVSWNGKAYCATGAITSMDIPGASDKWLEGMLYTVQESVPPEGAEPGTIAYFGTIAYRWAHIADGLLELLHVWAPVDLRGYIFSVDVLNAPQLGIYWGYYSPKHFKDYGTGDIVAYVSDNVLYLYRRNNTDIRDDALEESYRPGNYKNPHWEEIYAYWGGHLIRDDRRWIRPISNAANAVIAKTGSLSEDMCRAYAYILGIPDEIVDAIGSKCSVFLYILLQRTRNTFDGFRYAFNAIGLDVSDLHRVYPTVTAAGMNGQQFQGVYPAEDTLKEIAKALHYGLLWDSYKGDPPDLETYDHEAWEAGLHWVRYWPTPEQANGGRAFYQVQEYRGAAWVTVYELTGFGDDHSVGMADGIKGNNRYYRASAVLLKRLATQALVSMGDGKQWIELNSFGTISQWLSSIIRYEVPMYIYIALSVNVASIDKMQMGGRGSRRIRMGAYGGTPTLIVHPTPYFDLATGVAKYARATVEANVEGNWEVVQPTSMRDGSDVYDFDKATYVRFVLENMTVAGYWTSRYTMGALGDNSGLVPIDASSPDFSGNEMQLCNGIVGVTPMVSLAKLKADLKYLKYNYVLSYTGQPWSLDTSTPFGSLQDGPAPAMFCMTPLDIAHFAGSIASVKDKKGKSLLRTMHYYSSNHTLRMSVYETWPEEIYIYDRNNALVALIVIPGLPHKVDPAEAVEQGTPVALLQLTIYEDR